MAINNIHSESFKTKVMFMGTRRCPHTLCGF